MDAYGTANRMPGMASTWLTAGASTFDCYRIQLRSFRSYDDFGHRTFD